VLFLIGVTNHNILSIDIYQLVTFHHVSYQCFII
jgi:hypothetical protein